MNTIYQLTKWHKDSVHPDEQTIGFYESWKDANLERRSLELNNPLCYEYMIYTRKVIAASEKGK
jgi:hypothetical protein